MDRYGYRTTRRTLLGAAGALGLGMVAGACSRTGADRRDGGAVGSGRAGPVVGLVWNLPLAQSATAAIGQGVRSHVSQMRQIADPSGDTGLNWWMVIGQDIIGTPIDLTSVLKEINFDPYILVPGAQDVFMRDGVVMAVPAGLQPLAIEYNPLALRAADVAVPSTGWTINDFANVCRVLKTAISSGKLKSLGISMVLSPLLDAGLQTLDSAQESTGPEWWATTVTLQNPILWEAFVRGYGGTVATAEGVAWTSGPAVDGITQLMELCHEYGNGSATPASARSASALRVIQINEFVVPPAANEPIRGLAAFPRLPSQPVLPANVMPAYAVYSAKGPLSGVSVPRGNLSELAEIDQTIAQFLDWLYQDAQQALLVHAGMAPVTMAGLRDSGYWSEIGMGDSTRPLQVAYPWPARAASVLHTELPKVAWGAIADPKGIKAALRTLSGELTAAMAGKAGRG